MKSLFLDSIAFGDVAHPKALIAFVLVVVVIAVATAIIVRRKKK